MFLNLLIEEEKDAELIEDKIYELAK